jgi:trehalose 6-phosphate synthase/phosphatase
MNLTAKEFVASNNKHGVLILSETAGAAEELQDALIVNPEQPETLVDALEQALAMRKRELRFRLRRMKKQVAVSTVQHWAKSFVDTLQQPQYPNYPLVKMLNVGVTQNLYSDFGRAKKRLLLLDYDGTLVPYVNHYNDAKPSKDLIKILKTLASLPATDVVLISGRTSANLTSWFKGIKVSLVAEHGLAIKRSGEKNWRNIEEVNSQWKELLQPILEKYAKLAPGARVEVKPGSLAWHYREAKPYQAQKYSVIIKKSLKPILEAYGLEMLQGSKVLEIKDPQVSKGSAVREWLRDKYSFILAIGDDNTDETMFRALPAHSYSIRVGGGRTSAKLRVASEDQALGLLRGLASIK